jgi:hypothetical protein
MVQASPGINVRPYLKNNQSKKDWGGSSSGRASTQKCKAVNPNPSIVTQTHTKITNIYWELLCVQVLFEVFTCRILFKIHIKLGDIAEW